MKILTIDGIARRELANGVFGPFCVRKWMDKAPDHVKRDLEHARKFPNIYCGRQGFNSMDCNDFPPTSFNAVSASATETNLWTPAIWSSIPANDMRAGKVYKVCFGGIFSSTSSPGTITFTARAGQSSTPGSNVSLGASNATAPPASLTNAPFYGEFTLGIRSLGLAASGAIGVGAGFVHVQGAAATTAVDYLMGGTVPTSIDNTAASGLIVSLTISVSSQSYQCQWVVLRSLN